MSDGHRRAARRCARRGPGPPWATGRRARRPARPPTARPTRRPASRAGVLEHADDAGGPLVGRALEVERGRRGPGRTAVPMTEVGPGVGHLGEQGAEGEDQAGVELLGHGHDLVAERAPPQLGLGAEQHHGVDARRRAGGELGGGPGDLARLAVDQADLRAGGGEVEELLGVDLGEAVGRPAVRAASGRPCVAASPASFHPSKAAITTGVAQRGTARPADVLHGREATRPASGTSGPSTRRRSRPAGAGAGGGRRRGPPRPPAPGRCGRWRSRRRWRGSRSRRGRRR